MRIVSCSPIIEGDRCHVSENREGRRGHDHIHQITLHQMQQFRLIQLSLFKQEQLPSITIQVRHSFKQLEDHDSRCSTRSRSVLDLDVRKKWTRLTFSNDQIKASFRSSKKQNSLKPRSKKKASLHPGTSRNFLLTDVRTCHRKQ